MSKLLPGSWVLATLEEVAAWGSGGTPKATNRRFYNGDIPWAVIGDLNDGFVQRTASMISSEAIAASSAKVVPPGTVLVAMYGSIGKLGITGLSMATNQAIAFAKPYDDVLDPRYLFYYLLGQRSALARQGKGATQQNISQTILRPWPIPLPPLREQTRIVAALDEEFSRIAAGVEALGIVKQRLNTILGAVLREALRPTGDASASDSRWRTATVAELAHPAHQAVLTGPFGTTLGREDFRSSGVPLLTIGCLKADGVDLKHALFISEAKATQLDRYRLQSGDVLFSRMASVGRAAIVDEASEGALINYHIMRLRLDPDLVDPKFLVRYVQASDQVVRYLREINHGVTRDGINTKQLLAMPITLPAKLEQVAIVAATDRAASLIAQLDRAIDVQISRVSSLRISILTTAFAGRLAPQDPTDEPASALVERIASRQRATTRTRRKVLTQTRATQ